MFPLFVSILKVNCTIHIICQVVNCDLSMQKCVKTNLILYSHFFFLFLIKMYIIFTAAPQEAQFGELNCTLSDLDSIEKLNSNIANYFGTFALIFRPNSSRGRGDRRSRKYALFRGPLLYGRRSRSCRNGNGRRARGIRGTQQYTSGSYILDRS